MELIIAFILFAVIVASWLVLPGSESEKSTGHSAAAAKTGKAGITA